MRDYWFATPVGAVPISACPDTWLQAHLDGQSTPGDGETPAMCEAFNERVKLEIFIRKEGLRT